MSPPTTSPTGARITPRIELNRPANATMPPGEASVPTTGHTPPRMATASTRWGISCAPASAYGPPPGSAPPPPSILDAMGIAQRCLLRRVRNGTMKMSVMALRVIQWATGGVGRAAIEGVLGHPELELVGCWVHSPEKSGRDVGELIGR